MCEQIMPSNQPFCLNFIEPRGTISWRYSFHAIPVAYKFPCWTVPYLRSKMAWEHRSSSYKREIHNRSCCGSVSLSPLNSNEAQDAIGSQQIWAVNQERETGCFVQLHVLTYSIYLWLTTYPPSEQHGTSWLLYLGLSSTFLEFH